MQHMDLLKVVSGDQSSQVLHVVYLVIVSDVFHFGNSPVLVHLIK